MTNKYFVSDEQCEEIIDKLDNCWSSLPMNRMQELRSVIKQVVEPIIEQRLSKCLAECEARDRVIAKLRSDLCKLEFGNFGR